MSATPLVIMPEIAFRCKPSSRSTYPVNEKLCKGLSPWLLHGVPGARSTKVMPSGHGGLDDGRGGNLQQHPKLVLGQARGAKHAGSMREHAATCSMLPCAQQMRSRLARQQQRECKRSSRGHASERLRRLAIRVPCRLQDWDAPSLREHILPTCLHAYKHLPSTPPRLSAPPPPPAVRAPELCPCCRSAPASAGIRAQGAAPSSAAGSASASTRRRGA